MSKPVTLLSTLADKGLEGRFISLCGPRIRSKFVAAWLLRNTGLAFSELQIAYARQQLRRPAMQGGRRPSRESTGPVSIRHGRFLN